MTEEEYQAALAYAGKLMSANPTPDSRYGRELQRIVPLIEAYERDHYPLKGPARSAGLIPTFLKSRFPE